MPSTPLERPERPVRGSSNSFNGNNSVRHNSLRPDLQRSLSDALRMMRSREEQETLLGDEEQADADGCLHGPEQIFCPNPHLELPVYASIHRIRRLVMASIDDPYTFEQLKEPRLNVLIVRPLVERLYDPDDVSTVYCLLVNRMQFLREQSFQSHHQTVSKTRANLCEIIASKILRRFDEENPGRPGLLVLANVLVSGFEPFQQAPEDVIEENREAEWTPKRGGYERTLTSLEIAIVSRSKYFLSGSACQKVVDSVYRGRVIYTPTAFIDLLPDYYKHKPISLYDPRKAPLLNQYRLIVPRTRNIIEFVQFLLLLLFYCMAMGERDHTRWTNSELIFAVYAAGWCLDEFSSMLEHGWDVHTQNLWSFLDVTFLVIYSAYIVVRLHGWSTGNLDESRQSLDILSVAAPVLLPRLVFTLMPENMLIISLRAMMADFFVLTLIAVWCFAGFLLSMRWLANGRNLTVPDDDITDLPNPITISKWMLWIWFGLDGTGIQEAPSMHFILGPTLMVTYAFLGNTLFLTVLVSILTNTFSKIASNANAEIQYRRAVLTFAGVKSDAIFAYRVPFNILALVFLAPIRYVVNDRWFHKTNVALVRALNFPILLAIHVYERNYLWHGLRASNTFNLGPAPVKHRKTISKWRSLFSAKAFNVHGDIQAVFDFVPPREVLERIEEVDELEDAVLENSFANGPGMYGVNGVTATGSNSGGPDGAERSRSPSRWRRRWSGSSSDVQDPWEQLHNTGGQSSPGEAGHSAAAAQRRRRLSSVVETP